MNISAKSLKTSAIVFAVLTILAGAWKIIVLLSKSPLYSLPAGLPVIFMLAAFGCFSAAQKKKGKESKNN